MMVYAYGLECGFDRSHFDVRKANEKVWQYHERWGAQRVGEMELDYVYEIDKAAILRGMYTYAARIAEGVRVQWAEEPR